MEVILKGTPEEIKKVISGQTEITVSSPPKGITISSPPKGTNAAELAEDLSFIISRKVSNLLKPHK